MDIIDILQNLRLKIADIIKREITLLKNIFNLRLNYATEISFT